MAHTWKYAFGLGLVGAALTASCVVKNGDDDVSNAGQSGEGGTGGTGAKGGTGGSTGGTTTGGTGGSSANGGTGGSTAGKPGTGGSAGSGAGTGGNTTGGTGGTSEAGMGGGDTGGTSGTGGSTSGSGGTGGTESDTTPTCDPIEGSTPYPSCAPAQGAEDDACALCVQSHCCEESNNCYATDPYNVCGWGGPAAPANSTDPDYSGAGEIGCYTQCLFEYVADMGVCDSDGIDACTSMCTTEMCNLVGDATNAFAGCMQDNCPSECFGADTCG